jgi:hypothetical protein
MILGTMQASETKSISEIIIAETQEVIRISVTVTADKAMGGFCLCGCEQ